MIDPNRVLIFDTTLRDGEQSPALQHDAAREAVDREGARRARVDVIEAGFPIASRGDWESVNLVAREVHGPIIAGLAHIDARLVTHDQGCRQDYGAAVPHSTARAPFALTAAV